MLIASIDLPWPSRELHPNARVHFMARAKAAKRCRVLAAWEAKAAGVRKMAATGLAVTAVFFPPDNRRRDTDGMLSSIKSYLDGIADVIGVDDSRWNLAIRREAPKKPGSVRVEISEVAI